MYLVQLFITSRVSGKGNIIGPVCVCLSVSLYVHTLTVNVIGQRPNMEMFFILLLQMEVRGQGHRGQGQV